MTDGSLYHRNSRIWPPGLVYSVAWIASLIGVALLVLGIVSLAQQ